MTWVKLDDKFHSNPKVLEAGLAAAGLYARALSYCGDHLTDGVVPSSWLNAVEDATAAIETLTEHGFWEPIRKGDRRHVIRDTGERVDIVAGATGYFIRDFLQINPSAVEVQSRRSERSVAGRKGAQSRWDKHREMQAQHGNSHTTAIATRNATAMPPTRPKDQNPSTSKDTPRATPPSTDRPWACTHCAIRTKREDELRSHLEHVHWLEADALEDALAAARGRG